MTMPAISNLFRRLGFVKLDAYGLILTPDDRVMSSRPTVLDDGLGGKIVGWKEGDLAAMELERWQPNHAPAKPMAPPKLPARPPIAAATVSPFAATVPAPAVVPAPVVAAPVPATATPVPATPPRRRLPGVATMPTPMPVVQVPVSAPVAPPIVAAPAQPEEDEWEWEIAMARARAAAEWAEEAAAEAVTSRQPALPARQPDPIQTETWPKTEPLNEVWEMTPAPSPIMTERVLRLANTPVVKLPAKPPTGPVRTVIPVPPMPSTTHPRNVQPVISTPRTTLADRMAAKAAPPRRVPHATSNSRFEETIRTHAATPVNDDETSPHLALPPAPMVGASGKRVAAKQR
jgi:hypothetical protein